MPTNESQEMLDKLQIELKKLKEEDPEQYLELLKTLNQGMEEIAADLKKAVRG